jgi:hypothetical protein
MPCHNGRFRKPFAMILGAVFCAALACVTFVYAGAAVAQDDNSPPITSPPTGTDPNGPQGTTKLKIVVTNPKGDPVSNASVYVRYYASAGAGLMHHDALQELDFKTNQDGSVKVPPVPLGKVQVQVIAPGWHTFGEWFDVEKDGESITIQLKEATHWY